MAPRPAWKGYLKLSLVSCAVELTGTTDHSEKVSFRIINRKTGNTVKRQYVDGVTGKPVEDDDEVKGYEIGDDEYLLAVAPNQSIDLIHNRSPQFSEPSSRHRRIGRLAALAEFIGRRCIEYG